MAKTLMMFPIAFLFLIIPIVIGVYVYKDAKDRNMNYVLWTIVSIFAPYCIGFIIYLIARGNYSDLICQVCKKPVEREFIICPNCETKLKGICSNCNTVLEKNWKVCPKCGKKVEEESIFPPIKRKDKILKKILIVCILVPIIFISTMCLILVNLSNPSGVTGVTTLPVNEYIEIVNNENIENWLNTCEDDYNKAYVLRENYVYKDEANNKNEEHTRYLIYMPGLVEMPVIDVKPESDITGKKIKLTFPSDGENRGETFVLVTCDCKNPKLELYYEIDNKIEYEMQDVDYSLELVE